MKKALLMIALVLMLGGSAWALVGDVNSDGIVDILDVVAVANVFGQASPDAEGNILIGDINGDGLVDIFDLVTVANNFGATK